MNHAGSGARAPTFMPDASYIVPYLYECYAKTYRKMHDLQSEISILTEAVEQMKKQGLTNKAIKFENQKRKAENKVQKDSERIVADNM